METVHGSARVTPVERDRMSDRSRLDGVRVLVGDDIRGYLLDGDIHEDKTTTTRTVARD
jgi:hypothetical protein